MEVSTEQLPSHQFSPDFDRQLQAYNRGLPRQIFPEENEPVQLKSA
jgi:hypothetical protein